jgi:hypothetical protein
MPAGSAGGVPVPEWTFPPWRGRTAPPDAATRVAVRQRYRPAIDPIATAATRSPSNRSSTAASAGRRSSRSRHGRFP